MVGRFSIVLVFPIIEGTVAKMKARHAICFIAWHLLIGQMQANGTKVAGFVTVVHAMQI